MNKKIFKNLLLVTCIISTTVTPISAYAQDNTLNNETTYSSVSKLSLSTVDYINDDSMMEISEKVYQYKLNNPSATEKDLDVYTVKLMQEAANNKQRDTNGSMIFNHFISYAEKQLIAERPSQWAAYFWCSTVAEKEALRRYTDNSCWWDGNGDAFRHTYWSAILMKRFNEIFGYSASKCASITLEWTTAHEAGDTSIRSEMDVQNNVNGRAIGYSLYSYEYMRDEAQDYVDRGMCVRLQDINGQLTLVPTDTTEKK